MEALHDIVKSGKVRYIGASSMWAYQFAQMQACAEKNGWTKFISMQNHYSLLYREEEREMNKYCTETGVGLIPVCRFKSLQEFEMTDIETVGTSSRWPSRSSCLCSRLNRAVEGARASLKGG